ncbi:hypothetical protein cypCar_00007432 [Cyprinus carpio]|nr:hypothetical protein cypCar_00007432 [Cyprinus carpio]
MGCSPVKSNGPASNVPPVYGLDVTDVTNWETTALEILDCLQKGEQPSAQPIRAEGVDSRNKRSHHMCDLCEKLIIGDLEWTGDTPEVQKPSLSSPHEEKSRAGLRSGPKRYQTSKMSVTGRYLYYSAPLYGSLGVELTDGPKK